MLDNVGGVESGKMKLASAQCRWSRALGTGTVGTEMQVEDPTEFGPHPP